MLAGILVVTTAAYLRCLGNGFVFDDNYTIVQNHYIGNWAFLWQAFTRDLWWFLDPATPVISSQYHPLQNVWFVVAYHLFGTNPIGWHILKIALHLCMVMLSFRLAQLLTGSVRTGLLTALFFGLMPIHVEPVVWASDIPEPLSAAFELGALCLFIRRDKTQWRGIVSPLLLFVGATLSHEMAIVFPLLIAAYIFLFETSETDSAASGSYPLSQRISKILSRSAPFFAVSILYMGVRAMVLGRAGILGFMHTRTTASLVNGALVFHYTPVDHTLVQTLMTLPTVLVDYIELLVFPWQAGPAHGVKFVTTPALAIFWVPVGIVASLAVLGYVASRKSARSRLYLFCALWLFVTLAPAFDFDQLWQIVADRYLYLPSFAFCLMLADCVIRFGHGSDFRWGIIAGGAAAALTIAYAASLWHLEPVWHDNLALFSRSVEMFPDSPGNRRALAAALVDRDEFEPAASQLAYASKLAPDDAGIHLALGMLYLHMRRGADAKREMEAYYHIVFNQKKRTAKQHWYIEFK